MAGDTSRISPTAHYTSYVWFRNGLSHAALTTPVGHALYRALQPAAYAYTRLGGLSLEENLLARHRVIDDLLEKAIAGGTTQVLELAAGMSARGMRFTRRHPALTYVEGDLPGMVARKRAALDGAGLRGPRHEIVELDALSDEAFAAACAARLDLARPVAVITEGLLAYFDRPSVEGLWRRIARVSPPGSVYLADVYLGDAAAFRAARAFSFLLGKFVGGEVHIHHADPDEARRELSSAGFKRVTLHDPRDLARSAVRIVEAFV